MGSFPDYYRHLFQYEQQSHSKVLAAMTSAPDDARTKDVYQNAIDMLAHIIAARRIWLWRIGASDDRPDGVFPNNVSIAALEAQMQTTHAAWNAYLAHLDDAELARRVDYKTLDGRDFSNTVEEMLIQLHGHSMYHRGQISSWMRQAGAQPAPTDYIWWLREKQS